MIVIGTTGSKGGTTKTTLTVNIAAGLALSGYRVLVIDTDGQANATQVMRGQPNNALYHLLFEDKRWDQVIQSVSADFTGQPCQLYLLPTDSGQFAVERNPNTPSLFYDRIQELDGIFDFVLVDTSPGTGEMHVAVYYAAHYVLLPTSLGVLSIQGLRKTLRHLRDASIAGERDGYPAAKVLGIVPNLWEPRLRTEQYNRDFLLKQYGSVYRVFESIRRFNAWEQSVQFQQSIYAYAPKDDYNIRTQARKAVNELHPVTEAVIATLGAVV